MYVGTKGWYVSELKKLGVSNYEGRKIEKYDASTLANLLESKKN
ncbi:YflJ family protein [Alkalibacillus aidingensis]|nr:YflJ family protein [Alkalibacillus aidingensis]